METQEKAKTIVDRIVSDLSDRSGLGDEWGQCDRATQKDIKKEWMAIVIEELEKPS